MKQAVALRADTRRRASALRAAGRHLREDWLDGAGAR
jgi:hypothetical protein